MDQPRGLTRALFATVLLFIGGVLNIIWGIAAISNSNFFLHNGRYIFASLRGWGWVSLVIGILLLLAAISLQSGRPFGVWFGIVMGAIAAIDALLDIPAYPFWSLAVFALSLWIVYGLALYGHDEARIAAEMASSEATGPGSPGTSSAAPPPPTA